MQVNILERVHEQSCQLFGPVTIAIHTNVEVPAFLISDPKNNKKTRFASTEIRTGALCMKVHRFTSELKRLEIEDRQYAITLFDWSYWSLIWV